MTVSGISADTERELNEVLAHYDLGSLAGGEKNTRGFVNTAYAITTLREGVQRQYFLRKYRPGIREEEVQFEHSLIEHLSADGRCPVAGLHKTRAGRSYLRRGAGQGEAKDVFYAIFDLLPGEDRYTWVGPRCTDSELKSSASTLAQFHQAVAGFTPSGRMVEPRIIDLLPMIGEFWSTCPARSKGYAFDALVLEAQGLVMSSINSVRARLSEPEASRMPQMVIHCDFHPGNLMFEGERVSGLFDFNWSKMDWRALDVALALWYFCASWEASEDGRLRLDKAALFLNAYQRSMSEGTAASELDNRELAYLPDLIQAANLYVLHWGVFDYYSKDVNPEEYLAYLLHSVRFTRWFDSSSTRRQLQDMCAALAP